ncbi:hypothetical protein [Sphingomonas sanxanigenens]|uniref:Mlr4354 like protein n=1 Tax=Sphingomonas sanxanigenens DSM 19645 = NX02 TaxID=1123269 RepID=W0AGB1_9SPHN|nr:hypothetical protein [Sphingomonas sanxanigenens]AHE56949.1 hypothetical protein NX02_26800 [Sphingomonas sanxanigenens DSM 19645 = NX02]
MTARTVRLVAVVAALVAAAPASGRDSLGVFGGWGAFRETRPPGCFAIAEPDGGGRSRGWRPFASVATWPGRRIRGQLHIRLSRAAAPGRPIELVVGGQRFALGGGGADAWARDAQADAAIVKAIRNAPEMRVTATGATGRRFTDIYPLRGAATAIDAATLGCARRL